jgi:hypothetical protein
MLFLYLLLLPAFSIPTILNLFLTSWPYVLRHVWSATPGDYDISLHFSIANGIVQMYIGWHHELYVYSTQNL